MNVADTRLRRGRKGEIRLLVPVARDCLHDRMLSNQRKNTPSIEPAWMEMNARIVGALPTINGITIRVFAE